MSTETASQQPKIWPARSPARRGIFAYLRDRRLVLVLLLALLAGFLAYQAPLESRIAIGWLGDRLFLDASQGLGAGDAFTFYSDEITGNAGDRSRWTRQDADINLPGLGGGDVLVNLRAQGWPQDAAGNGQPTVEITANGVPITTFTPPSEWTSHEFRVPASANTRDTLTLHVHSSGTFTGGDPRPKGIRIDALELRGAAPAYFVRPALLPLVWLIVCSGLSMLALLALTRRPNVSFVLTTLLISVAAIALALARVWAAALLPWLAALLLVLMLLAYRRELLALGVALLRRYARGRALNYGLVALVAAWLIYLVGRLSATLGLPGVALFRRSFPDSLLYGMLGTGLVLLVLVRGRQGLPRLAGAIVRRLGARRWALALLGLAAIIWLGYEATLIAQLPYVGHADYADNAVVARNLVRGRGWVVDYVTQFYQLNPYGPGVTRPQETWPLMQPVWIAPFFLLFGPVSWAAKIPNLVFMALLVALIYAAGARIWDRRVGLSAALMILTNYLFFRLVIYATSDLAFVVFSFGAIYLLYRAVDDRRLATDDEGRPTKDEGQQKNVAWSVVGGRWSLLGSGILTGLMLLQKPSGALIAAGMGVWLLLRLPWRDRRALPRALAAAVLWGGLALVILAPYLARNMLLFGKPFYSTESHDAWVLGFGDWEDIYRVFTRQGNLSADGVPDRSWVLRWGFDVTLLKLATQAQAVRNYLLPPWFDQSRALSDPDSQKKALLFGVGAWLALLGALGALRSRRGLLALLVLAFGPYFLFLVGYWHADEERYFLMVMPWMALLAAYALWRGYDRVAAIGDGRWAPAGLVLALVALALVVAPSWPYNAKKVREEPALYRADTDAYTWLRTHTDPGDVVMTRLPWQLNWVSERPALMVPNTRSREVFLKLARYYGVRYLVRDTFAQPSADTRDLLDGMLEDDQLGFEEVYATPPYSAIVDGQPTELVTHVYRLPADYGGVAAIAP